MTCQVCGKSLPAARTRPFAYCSHACRSRAHYARHREEVLARRRAARAVAQQEEKP
jgi:predicted nucleic acid-binding Zn ribbon protein